MVEKGLRAIFCYGDSNTYGWDPRDMWGRPYEKPWPALLGEMLSCRVINDGQPGREIPTRELQQEWMLRDLKKESPVDAIVIMLGTNDVLNQFHPDAEAVGKRMEGFLQFLKEREVAIPVVVVAPPHIDIPEPARVQAMQELAAVYQQIALQYDCRYIDASTWELELAYDGIHLTDVSHQMFAEKLYAELKISCS